MTTPQGGRSPCVGAAVMAAPAPGDDRAATVVLDGHVREPPADAHRVDDARARRASRQARPHRRAAPRRSRGSRPTSTTSTIRARRGFRRFRTARELSDCYGPSRPTTPPCGLVRAERLRGDAAPANRMTFTVTGTRATAAPALDVAITTTRRASAIRRQCPRPRLPREVARRVQAVVGLSTSRDPAAGKRKQPRPGAQ